MDELWWRSCNESPGDEFVFKMADEKKGKVENVVNKGGQNVQIRSTLASRMINPELFIRPNKVVMGVGVIMITGCVICLALMNSDSDDKSNVKKRTTRTETIRKRSKWD